MKVNSAGLGWVIAVGCALGACEKAKPATAPRQGPVATSAGRAKQTQLLQRVRKGNLLFGGDMKAARQLADLPGLQQVTNSVTAPTVQVVNRCWQEAIPSEGVGTFAINGMTLIASTYYEGVKLPALFACLQAGGVAAQLDADQQYMQYTVEVVPGTANTSALLVVGDGVYMEIQLALGALLGRGSAPAAQPSDRKLLEATQTDLARHSEQSAVAMLPMVEKLTARDDIWVVGSAAGTLLETQLGEVQMTFRVDDGVALQGALEMKDAAKAKEMVEKLEATKQQIERAPLDSAVKALVKSIELRQSPSGITFALTAKPEMISALGKLAAAQASAR